MPSSTSTPIPTNPIQLRIILDDLLDTGQWFSEGTKKRTRESIIRLFISYEGVRNGIT